MMSDESAIDYAKYIFDIETHGNADGSLSVLNLDGLDFPFIPRRVFYIYGVPEGVTRGKHAHKICQQFFVQLSGQCKLKFVNKYGVGETTLNSPAEGFLAEPLTWCEISDFSADSVVMVFASHQYDPDDYIHNFSLFTSELGFMSDSGS